MSELYGITDVPCKKREEDSLGIESYIKGLEEFITKCPTPMSIALQGDWGTGKTSFLQAMKNDFEEEKNIYTIYFNTWQYSQFNMSDNLYTSFINNIVKKLGELSGNTSMASEMTSNVFKVGSSVLKQVVKNVTDIDIKQIESEALHREEEKAKAIESMKDKFEEMVAKTVKDGGRVVIFVDDLDRLNPEIAVEMLEVMKLFMDVPNCIYILAIDYEVVVSGVRKKFGSDMSEEKCRSFFDKIIQLPFRMPVDSYKIEEMIKDVLGDRITSYIEPVSRMIRNTLGTNPRTFKRLANSFFLLETVEMCKNGGANAVTECHSALLFVSLIAQMYCYDAYVHLIDCTDAEELETLFAELDNSETELEMTEKEKVTLEEVRQVLKDIDGTEHTEEESIYEKFVNALNVSSITSVNKVEENIEKVRKKAMKVNRIVIEGKEYAVKNPTFAQMKTYEVVLHANIDKLDGFMEAQPRILTFEENPKSLNGFFRAPKELGIVRDGKPLTIGTSSSSNDKKLFTTYLCEFVGMKPDSVIWYDDDEIVYKY